MESSLPAMRRETRCHPSRIAIRRGLHVGTVAASLQGEISLGEELLCGAVVNTGKTPGRFRSFRLQARPGADQGGSDAGRSDSGTVPVNPEAGGSQTNEGADHAPS